MTDERVDPVAVTGEDIEIEIEIGTETVVIETRTMTVGEIGTGSETGIVKTFESVPGLATRVASDLVRKTVLGRGVVRRTAMTRGAETVIVIATATATAKIVTGTEKEALSAAETGTATGTALVTEIEKGTETRTASTGIESVMDVRVENGAYPPAAKGATAAAAVGGAGIVESIEPASTF